MLSATTTAKILQRVRIEEIAAIYTSLRDLGVRYEGNCPFHEGEKGTLRIYPDKQIFHCIECGKKGAALQFVMEIEQINRKEALRRIASFYEIDIEETDDNNDTRTSNEHEETAEETSTTDIDTAKDHSVDSADTTIVDTTQTNTTQTAQVSKRKHYSPTQQEKLYQIHQDYEQWLSKQLYDTNEGRDIALTYLKDARGFSDEIIKAFGLGYSTDDNANSYYKEAQQRFDINDIANAGICYTDNYGKGHDRFRGRVMFPVYSVAGRIIAFSGRIMKKADNVGKYINSPESKIYTKGKEIYGLYQARQSIETAKHAIIVEGNADVVSMHQNGFTNVVASLGTALTTHQANLLHRFTDDIIILYDGDAAGIKAALKAFDILLKEGFRVHAVLLPNGEDPDSYVRNTSKEDMENYIANNKASVVRFYQLLLERNSFDVEKTVKTIKEIEHSISLVEDKVLCNKLIYECSALFKIKEKTIKEDIKRIRHAAQEAIANTRIFGEKDQEVPPPMPDIPPFDDTFPPMDFPPIDIPTDEFLGDTPINQDIPPLPDYQEVPPYDSNIPLPPAPDIAAPILVEPEIPPHVSVHANEQKECFPYDRCERNIFRLLVMYGNVIVFEEEDGSSTNVAKGIALTLKENNMVLYNPVFQKMLDSYLEQSKQEPISSIAFFVNHEDDDISSMAFELLTDTPEESRMYSKPKEAPPGYNEEQIKMLQEKERKRKESDMVVELSLTVTAVIYEYLYELINNEIEQLFKRMMRLPATAKEQKRELLQQHQALNRKRLNICEVLKKSGSSINPLKLAR